MFTQHANVEREFVAQGLPHGCGCGEVLAIKDKKTSCFAASPRLIDPYDVHRWSKQQHGDELTILPPSTVLADGFIPWQSDGFNAS